MIGWLRLVLSKKLIRPADVRTQEAIEADLRGVNVIHEEALLETSALKREVAQLDVLIRRRRAS